MLAAQYSPLLLFFLNKTTLSHNKKKQRKSRKYSIEKHLPYLNNFLPDVQCFPKSASVLPLLSEKNEI